MHSNMFFKIVIVIISFLITTNLCGVSAQEYIDYDKLYNEAIGYGQIGDKFFSVGQWDDAIESYKKTLETFESCGDEYNQAVTLTKIGVVYAHKNELDTALRYLQDSYNISLKDAEIDENEVATMGNLGKVYLMRGESDKAIELFNKALSWSEERNDTRGMALAIANIGGYYREMKDYPTAIEYHLQAADLFNKSGDLREEGGQLRNVGFAYYLSNDAEKSLYYYDEAEYLFSRINDTILIDRLSYFRGLSYNSIGIYYKRIDNFNESIKYSELVLSESTKMQKSDPDDPIFRLYALLEMGDLYSLQGSHENAIDSYQTALYFLEDYRSVRETTDEVLLEAFTTFISAQISFEKAVIQSEELNYNEAVALFDDSAEKIKSLFEIEMFSYKKPLLEGYYHYSTSKKNLFLFKSTGNADYKELSEDELLSAKNIFNEFGAPELARMVVMDKIVNYPYSPILRDEYIILLQGMVTTSLTYPKELVTSEIGYIKFNYKYSFNIPPEGLPMIKFCCGDFCSDWIKIKDNEMREVAIPVQSNIPTKVYGDIKIYGEDKPDIALGKIEDYYWPSFEWDAEIVDDTIYFFPVVNQPYETINIVIKKPLIDKIIDQVYLISAIFGIVSFGIVLFFGGRRYLNSRKKKQEPNIKSKNKKHGKGSQSKKKKKKKHGKGG